ncbi:NCK-ASSOCIATED PROTEIN 1 [Salix viminalis]|uniref:NCK-ASSOCIATED PROTEIN 1 n=1 Tax=Salix viminalis TaxID=40686 RepID=A0A9Q0NUV2_SALVM|nr:NCK-ASSOCIATED PROTEIN 1 [Salix viminalis]
MSAVIAGSELVRLEREHQQRQQSLSNGHRDEALDPEIHSCLSAEASIKSAMQLFVKFATERNFDLESNLVAKLIFLDQLCESSPYLPRNSLEAYVPYAILRSIYSQYYSNSPSMPLALLSVSPRHSPAAPLSHTSLAVKQPRGDSSSHSQHRLDDMDSGSLHGSDNKHRNVRRSGPLDYSSSRKVKLVIDQRLNFWEHRS